MGVPDCPARLTGSTLDAISSFPSFASVKKSLPPSFCTSFRLTRVRLSCIVAPMTQTLSFASPAASACLKESLHQRLPFRPAPPPLHGGKIRRQVTFTDLPFTEELCPEISSCPASEMLTHPSASPAHSATFRNFSIKTARNCRFCAKKTLRFSNWNFSRRATPYRARTIQSGIPNSQPSTLHWKTRNPPTHSTQFHQKAPPFHFIPHRNVASSAKNHRGALTNSRAGRRSFGWIWY